MALAIDHRNKPASCNKSTKTHINHKTKTKLHHILGRTGQDCKPYLPQWGKLYLFKIKV